MPSRSFAPLPYLKELAARFGLTMERTWLNMSLSLAASSEELQPAIEYASKNRMVLMSSVGNSGREIMSYPAGYKEVVVDEHRGCTESVYELRGQRGDSGRAARSLDDPVSRRTLRGGLGNVVQLGVGFRNGRNHGASEADSQLGRPRRA